MYYYHVLVSSPRYHKDSPLTYSCAIKLERGTVVKAELQRRVVLGVIHDKTIKPHFTTKPLTPLEHQVILPSKLLELIEWFRGYYPAALGQIIGLFLPSTLLATTREPLQKLPADKKVDHKLPQLTAEQQGAVKIVLGQTKGSFLLHGDTGSGKTRVYLEAAKATVANGRSVIILTPEIGLTSQLVELFHLNFPNQTILLHSNLTPRERRSNWLSISRTKTPLIVIGPRSALFSPLASVGLIVMDEAHDTAYKQEQAPYYQTLRVAGRLAGIHSARFIIGSGTPLVQDYYLAAAKKLPIIRMVKQASQKSLLKRKVEVIDLRNKDNLSNSSLISKRLLQAIGETLEKKNQSLIFLNRRGTARLIICSSCGWQADCPRCDVPLAYHSDNHRFICHTCGFTQPASSTCPACHGADILFKSVGTKAIVSILEKEFPGANIQRFDTDNKKKDSLAHSYNELLSGNTDILVGTQMIGKGLDLPKLGLVGVLAADASLYFPDYTAEERTYQLLTQVIGRVGRGHIEGKAVIQTYSPENETLKHVINGDWDGFYQQQLEERRLYMFPPYCHMMKLICSRSSPAAAETQAKKLLSELSAQNLRIQFIGPSPSFHHKVAGKYRWQVIAKAKDRGELLKVIPLLPSGWAYDLDPVNLL